MNKIDKKPGAKKIFPDDESKLDHACRAYLGWISQGYREEDPPYPPAHIATLARLIHVLALRAVAPCYGTTYTTPGFTTFMNYAATTIRLNTAIEQAILSGALNARDRTTGLVFGDLQLSGWDSASKAVKALGDEDPDQPGDGLGDILSSRVLHFPGYVAVDLREFCFWAESQGIVSEDELPVMLKNFGMHSAYYLMTGETSKVFSPPNEDQGMATGTACVQAWPWGSYETKNLRILAEAAMRFWINYDPDDPTTAETNDTVSDWIQENYETSERVARAIATILRADGLQTGPRK